jgi:hypothetical protein
MPGQYLHGVLVTEVESAAGTTQTLASSVIGLVGTAPGAQASASASLAIGTVGANNGITLTAAQAGSAGNNISLSIRTPGVQNAALSIQVNSNAIVVNLATSGATPPAVTTTATQLLAALEANADVMALVTAAATGGSSGAGLVASLNQTFLAGGLDAVGAVNVPYLVTSESQIAGFGTGGTIPQALQDIFDQGNATVVVVVVAQVENEDSNPGTITNVIGALSGTTYTGLKALLGAENQLGVIPRIIIATGFSQNLSVANEMLVEAAALRSIAVIDGPNTDDADAVAYIQNFGSARAYVVDPGVQITSAATGLTVTAFASARVAGLISANDQANGFWTSPSNQLLANILGTTRPVDFSFNNPNCRANYLNSLNIATIIRVSGGFRLWGDRSASIDPNFAFLQVRRTADIIEDSIQRAHLWAVDKNITKDYLNQVVASVQGYLDSLKALGAILDGTITADPSLKTVQNIQTGKVYFDISFTPPTPAEQVNFTVNPVATSGYASLLSNSSS